MIVVVAMIAVAAVAASAVVIVPSVPTAHRAKMLSHPSRVSQKAIALLVNLEQIAHRVSHGLLASHVQKAKSNASHMNLGLSEHHAPRVLIVQTCANHAKAMHQYQQRHHKL